MEEKNIKKLYRSNTDRVFLGVCGGLGEYYEVDSNVIRLFFVLFGLLTGPGALIFYVLMAFIIPNKPGSEEKKVTEEIKEKVHEAAGIVSAHKEAVNNSKNYFAVLLVILGLLLISGQMMPAGFFFLRMIWPAIIIFLGAYLLIK